MGFSHSWIAVQGLSRETALAELGLEAAGELDPGYLPKLGIGQLPGGWLIVLSNNVDAAFKAPFTNLARHGSAVACAVEEHVMVSEARGYANGAQVWRVFHDPELGEDHLQKEGALPAAADRIEAELRTQQTADEADDLPVDYIFDVAPRIAETVCGFRLGEPEPDCLTWSLLRKAKGKGFFAKLFGG